MQNYRNYFLLTILCFAFMACEETIDLELPDYENDIVLYGVLIGGEKPQILLTESTGYFEPLNNRDRVKVIPDAQVTLNDGTQNHKLTFDTDMTQFTYRRINDYKEWVFDTTNLGGYTNDLLIEEGKTYSIEIKHQDRIITGITTVPKNVALKRATSKTEIFKDPIDIGTTCFEDNTAVHFDDPVEENFYELNANVERWSYRFCDQFVDTSTVELDSCVRSNDNRFYPIFSDQAFNGTSYNHNLGNSYSSCYGGDFVPDTIFANAKGYSIYKFALHAVSKEWFDFETSLDLQSNSEGNPFQEPNTIKSSIEGGIGVFASKAAVSDTVVLKVYNY